MSLDSFLWFIFTELLAFHIKSMYIEILLYSLQEGYQKA